MSNLEDILMRVENKLILSTKVYSALTYLIWIVIMAGYYLLVGVINANYIFYTAVYWIVGFIVYFVAMGKIIKNIEFLRGEDSKSKIFRVGIFLSWIVAAIIGWFFIPYYLSLLKYSYLYTLGVGLLGFISIANVGMIISEKLTFGKTDYEMYPSVFIPSLLIIVLPLTTVNPIYYAGMGIVVGYSLTGVLYLYSVFKYAR